jgi:signal transduction histidine kinase
MARLAVLGGSLFILETAMFSWLPPTRVDGVSVLVGIAIAADALLAIVAFGGVSRYVIADRVDASDERKQGDRLKDEFVATVSHELRTPLTSIAGSLGLILGGAAGQLPQPALRLLTIAHNNSQRLVRLINELLDMEKLQSGQSRLDIQVVEFRSLVAQAVEEVRGFADGYNVEIRVTEAAAGHVKADADRLVQVVTNLLSNAIKFSPAGAAVDVAVAATADSLQLSVRDYGRGIPPELKPRIFQKFAQASSAATRNTSGTGLGLSITREIVSRLGGSIGFEDAPGGGTRFFVTLPAIAETEEPCASIQQSRCEPREAA